MSASAPSANSLPARRRHWSQPRLPAGGVPIIWECADAEAAWTAALPARFDDDRWLETFQPQVIKHGPHRTVYRLQIAGRSFVLKHYRIASWRSWLTNQIRRQRPRRERAAAELLRAANIPTISVTATGHPATGKSPFTGDSFLLTPEIPAVTSLDEVWLDREKLSPAERKCLAEQLGKLVSQLHGAGLVHRDLHPGNVLVANALLKSRNPEHESPALWLIDVLEVRRPFALTTRQRLQNLAELHNYFARRATPIDKSRFLRAYLKSFANLSTRHAFRSGRWFIDKLTKRIRQELAAADRRGDKKWNRRHRHLVITKGRVNHVQALASCPPSIIRKLAGTSFNDLQVDKEFATVKGVTYQLLTLPANQHCAREIWHTSHALSRRQLPIETPVALVTNIRTRTAVLLIEKAEAWQPLSDWLRAKHDTVDGRDDHKTLVATRVAKLLSRFMQTNFVVHDWQMHHFQFRYTNTANSSADIQLRFACTLPALKKRIWQSHATSINPAIRFLCQNFELTQKDRNDIARRLQVSPAVFKLYDHTGESVESSRTVTRREAA